MSKLVENSLIKVAKTTWFLDKGVLEIRDAVLVFSNFSGQKNQWGSNSKNFNIVLPPDLVEYLSKLDIHVNIHKYPKDAAGTEEEPCFYYINAKVNMDNEFPPVVSLFVKTQHTDETGAIVEKKSKTTLTDATVGCLDRTDFDRVDVLLNLRESKAHPGNAVFYLKKLNAIQTKIPDFGGIYDDWDEEVDPKVVATEEIRNED